MQSDTYASQSFLVSRARLTSFIHWLLSLALWAFTLDATMVPLRSVTHYLNGLPCATAFCSVLSKSVLRSEFSLVELWAHPALLHETRQPWQWIKLILFLHHKFNVTVRLWDRSYIVLSLFFFLISRASAGTCFLESRCLVWWIGPNRSLY